MAENRNGERIHLLNRNHDSVLHYIMHAKISLNMIALEISFYCHHVKLMKCRPSQNSWKAAELLRKNQRHRCCTELTREFHKTSVKQDTEVVMG